MTHDYKRHGTTTLFAALDVKSGTVRRIDFKLPIQRLVCNDSGLCAIPTGTALVANLCRNTRQAG